MNYNKFTIKSRKDCFHLTIRQLPESLANKIAAGEVVERPASVVKELIENSIDAQSNWIKVDLQDAGLQQIKITDNGRGMVEEDCKKSILRHATSKITYDTDLFHIKTLGFRGEALASIAAVSKLTIKSSTGDQAGTKLYLEAGELITEEKSDARQGTEITVDQLFFNTPARLKYMKTVHTELSHITDLINRYALACPHIRFDIFHNGKNIFSSSGNGNRLQVIATIYGTNVARNMIQFNEQTDDFNVNGFIAKPEITRASRNYMTLIINGRYVKSQPLIHAILRAYDALLPIHRSPIVVLSVDMDPILVDVNVHPTKLEVRFSKEKELINLIETSIKQHLKQTNLIPEIKQRQKREKEQTIQEKIDFSPAKVENYGKLNKEETRYQPQFNQIEHVKHDKINENISIKPIEPEHYESDDVHVDDFKVEEKKERLPKLFVIGQFQGTYILAQNEDGFYMIDQHAAQERIKYEFFRRKLSEPNNELQTLLMPLTFEFTKEEQLFINKHEDELAKAGLYFERFGENTFAVRSYPRWFPDGLEEDIIRDMVEQIVKTGEINLTQLREELAIMLSCKRSIKANHYLTDEEMERLLSDLSKVDVPFTCPHGRPVIIHFTTYEIEKMFKRIM